MPRTSHPYRPLATVFTLLACTAAWGAGLYPAPEYLGDIRRNAQGDIITVPPPAPKVSAAAPPPPAVTPVVAPTAQPRLARPTDRPAPPQAAIDQPAAWSTASRILRVGPAQTFRSIAAAAAQVKDGDTVEIDAGDYVGDVAVWNQNRLTLRGMGGPVKLLAGGKSAQGKAIWVIRGNDVLVENIQFSAAQVPDRNGAGIRFEAGRLTVKNCTFTHNENGILTANDAQAELVIENSEFGYNGAGDGYSHNLYVGHIKKLTVTGSYFHHAKTGHLLKSRASENHIFYNRLTDETGGTASYELDLPNGGLAYVVGNIVQQSSTTSNVNLITFGEEGYTWPRNELYLNHNTLVDDSAKGGFFLRYAPGLQRLLAANNVLVGEGTLDGGLKRRGLDLMQSLLKEKTASPTNGPAAQIDTDHNINAGWQDFVQASRFDYRPKDGTFGSWRPIKLAPVNGVNLQPGYIYTPTTGKRQLSGALQQPGAIQAR